MKKLLFAIAGAASFAALAADPTPGANDIDVLGFENFDLTDTENVSGAVVARTDSGIGGTSKWSCQGDDASLVKTYGGENAAKGNGLTFPGPFEDEGDQYLALDTNGSELQRAIGTTVAASGTYIDTLVQFTPSESAPTGDDLNGAKLAIWLGVDSEHNTTNLMVQGSFWDFADAPVGSSQAFALTGKTIEPGTWYRLTVKAIPNFMNADSGMSIPAFQILVDGTEMTLATAPLSAGFLELLDQSSMYASADIKAAMTANKLVPSIQDEAGAYGATVTLTSVGFKGTGALDDFVVTTEAPDFTPAGGDDYVVEIAGSDVVITPQEGDLTALQAAIVAGGGTLDVTDVDAVNAALAAPIGTTGIPSWQAIFLGLPPTEAGLESFKIDSISFDEDGNVVVELPDDVDPKTGRGVDITIKLMGSDDLTNWTFIENATGTAFGAVTPASGETKKFYKVVVEYAASQN